MLPVGLIVDFGSQIGGFVQCGRGVLADLAWQIVLGEMGFRAMGLSMAMDLLWVCLWLWVLMVAVGIDGCRGC